MKSFNTCRRFRTGPFAAFIGCLSLTPHALAVTVLPGETTALSGTTASAEPNRGGVIFPERLLPFQVSDGFGNVFLTGTYHDRVQRSTNLGTLVFAPRLTNLSEPLGNVWITGVRVVNFAGVFTDIDFRLDGTGEVGASQVSRSGGSGSSLDFSYASGTLSAPSSGYFLSILTDSLDYNLAGSVTIFARTESDPTIFSTVLLNVRSPIAPVPEPSAALFGCALAAVGVLRRKRGQ